MKKEKKIFKHLYCKLIPISDQTPYNLIKEELTEFELQGINYKEHLNKKILLLNDNKKYIVKQGVYYSLKKNEPLFSNVIKKEY